MVITMKGLDILKIWIVVAAALCCFCDAEDNLVQSKDWDHIVFSQEWATSVCIDANLTKKHRCSIPANVTTWGVHGLWPSEGHTQGPSFCNNSAKFDPEKIQSILGELYAYWPNLFDDTAADDFWEHEWQKHGTCALSLQALSDELKYFTVGLKMRETFDLLTVLAKSNIVPSDSTTYPYVEFVAALNQNLVTPHFSCVYDKTSQTQYIGQIEICLDKTFAMIPCPSSSSSSSSSNQRYQKSSGLTGQRTRNAVQFMSQRKVHGPSKVGDFVSCRTSENIAFPLLHRASRAI